MMKWVVVTSLGTFGACIMLMSRFMNDALHDRPYGPLHAVLLVLLYLMHCASQALRREWSRSEGAS